MTSEVLTLVGILILIAIAIYLFVKPSHPNSKKNGHNGHESANTQSRPLNRRSKTMDNQQKKEKEDLFSIPQVKVASLAEKEKKERLQKLKPKSAENSINSGVEKIKLFDPSFKIKDFLKEAEKNFTDILYAFAKGDKEFLKLNTHKNVYQSFEEVINEREKHHEVWQTKIKAFKIVDLIKITIEQNIARIQVKFVTHQIATIKDEAGQVIHGDPDVPEEYRDIWTFERALDTNAPWKFVHASSEQY